MNSASGKPAISVVMTTYNGGKYLREQLDTLLAQDLPDFELLIADDCSLDDTREILEEYRDRQQATGQSPFIKLHFNPNNLGYIKNFEQAIKMATGNLIALCDQDDRWMPGRLSAMVPHIDKADIIFCDSELIDAQGASMGKKISDIKNLRSYSDSLPFSIGNCASGHAMLMKKEFALSAMPFPAGLVHDWWLAFCAATRAGLYYIDLPLVQYRQHPENILGAVKPGAGTRKKQKDDETAKIRARMLTFANRAEKMKASEAHILRALAKSYKNFSLIKNYQRMSIFLQHRDRITAIKKRSAFRRTLFCLKMFFKVI